MVRTILLVACVISLSACGSSDGGSKPSSAAAPSVAGAPAQDSGVKPSGDPCSEVAFEVATVRAIQQGTSPGEVHAVAQRLYNFSQAAPPEIKRAAQGATGPAIIAMQHPDRRGEVSTDAVQADVQVLETWHKGHC
ncbi:hypothetical protein [Nocardia arthritidis]|uniref:DUF732 domain-containing protein n=1 Tax=Nocardia arthritidis TaxID=228602 RepID=A0A6G9Y3Z9_9NOCA|nr:hypothetical protein [Nocardia arthritidis]QIS07955.1 hypothetical protein F5544_00095 [Nocardia arthritidis]